VRFSQLEGFCQTLLNQLQVLLVLETKLWPYFFFSTIFLDTGNLMNYFYFSTWEYVLIFFIEKNKTCITRFPVTKKHLIATTDLFCFS
jgi:hypothetical protein